MKRIRITTPIQRTLGTALALLLLVTGLTGCANLNNTSKGATIGAGAGAVLGGIIGKKKSDDASKGAIIGAAIGGTAGAIIGAQMDKQAKELEEELENARVERVDEGIQITFDSAILFDVDSASLRAYARENLDALGMSLRDYPNTDLVIVGHTDATGSDAYNQQLSERRANAAANFLLQSGVSSARLTTYGMGESEPVANNATLEGRQQNRRVEIAIFASEAYRDELAQGETY